METVIQIIPLIYITGLVIYSIYSSNTKNNADYTLGHGEKSVPLLSIALIATIIGPGFTIGVYEQSLKFGFTFNWIYYLQCIWLIFLAFNSKKLITILSETKTGTTGEIFSIYYNKNSEFLLGFISFMQSIILVTLLARSATHILTPLYPKISPELLSIIFLISISMYTIIGGMNSLARADVFNFILMVIFGSMIVFFITQSDLNNQETKSVNFMPITTNTGLINVCIAMLFGEAFLNVYNVKLKRVKSVNKIRLSLIICSILLAIWFTIFTFWGYINTTSSNILPSLNPLLSVLLTIGLLGVITSTLDSVLHAGGVSFTSNLVNRLVKFTTDSSLTQKNLSQINKISTFIVLFVSILLLSLNLSIFDLLIYVYSIWIPVAIVPCLYLLLINSNIDETKRINILRIVFFSVLIWVVCEFNLFSITSFNIRECSLIFSLIYSIIEFTFFHLTLKRANETQ
jgi:Na+/proline symporter